MPTIKLNPLITDIRNRMGSTVFSKWKGVNYVRGYVSQRDSKTEDQMKVRGTFSRLVGIWKGLGQAVQNTWTVFSSGTNMTGYNAFIAENFENMKADLALILSQPMDEEPVSGFSAASGASAGSIDCSFQTPAEKGKQITLFAQQTAGTNGNGKSSLVRLETGQATSPVTMTGLEPGAGYRVYAVLTDGPYADAKKVSESVCAEAKAGAAVSL